MTHELEQFQDRATGPGDLGHGEEAEGRNGPSGPVRD